MNYKICRPACSNRFRISPISLSTTARDTPVRAVGNAHVETFADSPGRNSVRPVPRRNGCQRTSPMSPARDRNRCPVRLECWLSSTLQERSPRRPSPSTTGSFSEYFLCWHDRISANRVLENIREAVLANDDHEALPCRNLGVELRPADEQVEGEVLVQIFAFRGAESVTLDEHVHFLLMKRNANSPNTSKMCLAIIDRVSWNRQGACGRSPRPARKQHERKRARIAVFGRLPQRLRSCGRLVVWNQE